MITGMILFFFSGKTGAQGISGHWYGIGMIQTSDAYNSYMSELKLRQKGKQVSGEFSYYFKDSLLKVPVSGSFDLQTRKLHLQPFPMIYYRSPNARNSIDAMLSGNFTLVISKTESSLNGSLVSDEDHKYTVPPINYRFIRSDDTLNLVMKDEETPAPKQESPVTPSAPASEPEPTVFQQRAKIYTRELEIENDRVRLEIFDNGEIDHDSISLFLNNKQILRKSMLTHRAIRMNIELDPTLEFNELSMFAENLGMIPPNTAALVLYDGTKRYEVLLSSDLSKSATLKLKKKTTQ